MSRYYFAYGSNMNPERMRQRSMSFTHYEHGVLQGYQLLFNKRSVIVEGHGAANVVMAYDAMVEGILYHLEDEQQIQQMDPFEGYPIGYSRECLPIQTKEDEVEAWVYQATPAYIDHGRRPARWYLNHLLSASHLLTEKYAQQLTQIHCLPDSDEEPG